MPAKIPARERFSFFASLAGTVLMPVGVTVLLLTALRQGDPWKIVSFTIYGITLLFLYAVATLYHAVEGEVKRVLNELDHCAIFCLIAGSYTPFGLVILRGSWGWVLFSLVWISAILGIAHRHLPERSRKVPEMAIYLGMGWLVLVFLRPLFRAFPLPGLALLGLGGVFYTGGTVFYTIDERFNWAHGVWHLFVLGGSICHFLTVLLYIA